MLVLPGSLSIRFLLVVEAITRRNLSSILIRDINSGFERVLCHKENCCTPGLNRISALV